jgi:hypothetical protein
MAMNVAPVDTDFENDPLTSDEFDGAEGVSRLEMARIALRQHFEEIGNLTRRANDWFGSGPTICVP